MSRNRILKLLGISKGTLYYQKKGYPATRQSCERVGVEDINVIKLICNQKPTYGTPRVKAILNRDHGLTLTSYKVYRIMKRENLLLPKPKVSRNERTHTGKIEVSESNSRWASDITSFNLWNKVKLRFTYILDCCDRNILAFRLGRHIVASDIEQMVQESLLKRFGKLSGNHKLEFLHDNGPEYLEKIFQKQLKDWEVINCNTPTYSPQSNGMCESFNGTFKRDYLYQNCLESEEDVQGMIGKWIEEYNNYAPHSGLGMMSPNDFFKLKLAA